MLATPRGARAVEKLCIGDLLCDADGTTRRLQWVGRVRLCGAELLDRPEFWPVRVRADALADGWPAGDLLVVPSQTLAVPGGAAVAARWLVNGVSVWRDAPTAPVDLFSLELDRPGIPLDSAGGFGLVVAAGVPDEAVLFAVRQHVARRAGISLGPLHGSLDAVDHHRLAGWAFDREQRDGRVVVEVVVNDVPHDPGVADRFRRDLEAAGFGDGRCSFLHRFNPPLDPAQSHLVRVRRAIDGMELPGSPALLDAVAGVAGVLAQIAPGVPLQPSLEQAAESLVIARCGQ